MTKNNVIYAADLFCGAGGSSTGLVTAIDALGYDLELFAVNHWSVAIDTHSTNHKRAKHFCQTLDTLDPRKVVPGGRLHLLVASPECVHHSNARGGKPMSEQSRASAWLILNWLEKLYVDCVLIENVKEFRSWGALGVNGRPLKSQRGKLYQQFLENLRALGYKVEDRVLNAADYGDATSRERLFIMARRDKKPIVFPSPTHAKKPYTTINKQTMSKWRPAREIIDWSLEGESIFSRKRPLAENTLKRIFAGLKKFCGLDFILPNEGHYRDVGALIQPYVVVLRNNVNHRAIDEPLPTITTLGSIMGLAQPYLVSFRKNTDGQDVDAPISTLTTKEHCGLAEPYLIALEHMSGEHNSRCKTINEPMQTICGKGSFGLISPYLVEFHGGKDSDKRVRSTETPLPTADTSNRFGLAQPFLIQFFGERNGQEPRTRSVDLPMWTVTAQGRIGLTQTDLETSNEVLLFSKDGELIGEIIGKLDIKFRMLQPHELAAAMSFPKSYSFAGNRAEQVKQIGNAVPCNLAAALCRSLIENKLTVKKEKAA